MSELDIIKSDLSEVKSDVNDLTTNVGIIKSEVKDIKQNIAGAMEKISDAMTKLASITEKLNYNIDEHKKINDKIEDLEETVGEQKEKLQALVLSHDACLDRRKIEADERKNSTWAKLKDKAVEYLFIALVVLVLYILATHFTEFLVFLNKNNINGSVNPM